jgi:type IV pilus assembly protein PilQ
MKQFWTLATVAAALSMRAPGAAALAADGGAVRAPTGAITGVSVVPVVGNADVVIAVDASVTTRDFRLAGPDRIVVDLSGATLAHATAGYDRIARGGVVNVRASQYRPDVVRLVITLDGPRDYTVSRDVGGVHVTVTGSGDASFVAWHWAANAPSGLASARRSSSPHGAADAPIVASATGAIAAPLAGTPPAEATATTGPAYPVPERLRLFQQATQSTQPRITATYQDQDIRDVLAGFAAFSGRTIIVGRDVQGTVTAEVRDQPWDIALQSILEAQGLAANEDQYGIITVDSFRNLLTKRASEPLVTELVSVNYVKASSLVEMAKSLLWRDCGFQGSGGSNVVNTTPGPGSASIQSTTCPTRGNVVADTATNKLVVTDAQSHIQSVLNYLHALDVRTPQVSIKAKIIFINRTEFTQLGLAYDIGVQNPASSGTFFNSLVQRNLPGTTNGTSQYSATETVVDVGGNTLAAVSNASRPYQSDAALSLLYTMSLGKFSLTSFLDATQGLQLSDVQAEPSVVTLDNRPAHIQVGEETPIRVIDANSAAGSAGAQATVTFKETGIILNVTPHITTNGQVLMDLHAEQSQLQNIGGDLGYNFFKREADTRLLVNDGQTAVIGGLTETTVTKARNAIPILGELPLLGNLFSQTQNETVKQDLLILITPHVLQEGDIGSAATLTPSTSSAPVIAAPAAAAPTK